ncbi:MAG: hypothetical protein U1E59_06215 [Amaricoccus sp.]
MAWTIVAVFLVAVVEIWLIWYAGRIVDVLGATPRSRSGRGMGSSSWASRSSSCWRGL